MPSDDPEIVSKLLEFLYTDNYTPLEVPSSVFSSSNPQYSSEPLRLQERNNDRRTFIIKLFHAHVYALAEKYSYQPLCELAASRVRQNLIYLGPQLLEYMVGVYEATPRTSAMRIANLMRGGEGKFVHGTAWDPDSMRHWVSTWWRADGGFEGANEEGGIMVEAFKRCPELARDLLVLVSDVAHDD
ncbi:hypothetical protein BDZ91DRAFT_717373 [Kalaharituber pfeilii]|nr:hypothetical protein BDZ91DRAFT_717373 [Kalaharituber pfeilii]